MHRFFVPAYWISGQDATLRGDTARQIRRVLRMSPGDEIVLLDNTGNEYRVRIAELTGDAVRGSVLLVSDGMGEPATKVTLYQGTLKGEKFQWVLQKCTELGVTKFVPVVCQRSVTRGEDAWPDSRYPRWRKIVSEASEQSGRCLLPELGDPVRFTEACEEARDGGLSIVPWEQEGSRGLRSALRDLDGRHVSIFIGPEGGLEEDEVAHAQACGVVPVSLGKRLLRSETAAIAAVAAVLYEAEETDL